MDIGKLLQEIGRPMNLAKGELVFGQGQTESSVYFLTDGLLKAFYTTRDGKELIKSFIQPGEFIGSLIACRNNETSTFSLMCLKDSVMLRVAFDDLVKLANEQSQVAQFFTQGLMELAIKKERREYEFLCLDAAQRFALFKKRNPELIDEITQNDVARYLGITPVALSRIKNREVKK